MYRIIILAAFLGVALYRSDLVIQEYDFIIQEWKGDFTQRVVLVLQYSLFLTILIFATVVISKKRSVPFDIIVIITGLAIGYLVERWGTVTGLWVYYTDEKPPLWIVPAWPLGALVIDRVNHMWRQWQRNNGPTTNVEMKYRLIATTFALIIGLFSIPAYFHPLTYVVFTVLLFSLVYRPRFNHDLGILIVGAILILPADLWGTLRQCWQYYTQGPELGPTIMTGVGFGIAFDSVVVLTILRLSVLIEKVWSDWTLAKSARP